MAKFDAAPEAGRVKDQASPRQPSSKVGAASSAASEHLPKEPRVWLLFGRHHGDNQQLLALANLLGWPSEVKRLVYKGSVPRGISEHGYIGHRDASKSDPLEAPWPDLVVAIGRKSVAVARWIKAQSGGRTIYVHLGRVGHPYRLFDLLITTPQYGLPAAKNALVLTLPITRRDPLALTNAANHWQERFRTLPRPWIGLFVGGPSVPLQFTGSDGTKLAASANQLVSKLNGSLLIATGPRTPKPVIEALYKEISVPNLLFPFPPPDPNPYPAILALADQFIVTADSVSMLADTAQAGKPVHVFELPCDRRWFWRLRSPLRLIGLRRSLRLSRDAQPDPIDRFYDWLVRAGVTQPSRFVPIITNRAIARGLVGRLSDGSSADGSKLTETVSRELAAVKAHILAIAGAH